MKNGNIVRSSVVLLVLAAGLLGIPSGPAFADTQPIGSVNQIFPASSGRVGTGMCIDIPGSSYTLGVQLIQWGCTGNLNQSWRLEPQNGGYQVVSNHNNLCWDVPYSSTTWGAAMTQWACTGGWNQTFYKSDNGVGTMTLVAAHSQQCVDMSGYGTNWGSGLSQWPCTGTDNQQFTTTARPSFGYIDDIVGTDEGVVISGWTIAANAPQYQLGYQVVVNGQVVNAPYSFANAFRPDVGGAYPGTGNSRGIDAEFTLSLPPGNIYTVCIQSQSFGVYATLRCGEVGLSEEVSTQVGGPVPLSNAIPNCKLKIPKANGVYGTINIQDMGLFNSQFGTATVNYSDTALAAGNQWAAKINKLSFTKNSGANPMVKVESWDSFPGSNINTLARFRNFCGGLFGGSKWANKARIQVKQLTMSKHNSDEQKTILMHELGHVLGMGHPGNNTSTTAYCASTVMNTNQPCPQGSSYFPTVNDINDINGKYP
jgi:Ricin-type beta-trefoil lectin domain